MEKVKLELQPLPSPHIGASLRKFTHFNHKITLPFFLIIHKKIRFDVFDGWDKCG